MQDLKTIVIDVYPWAAPTDEQKIMFDKLPREEQLRMIEEALEEGFNSGISNQTVAEIIAEARAQLHGGV